MLASLTHTRSLHGGFLKLKQQNCNRIKSDGCTICLLDAKIAFGCFIFYILLSLYLSLLCVCCQREITARVVVDAASVCPVGAGPIPLGLFPNEV